MAKIAAKHIDYLVKSVFYVNGMGEDAIYLSCIHGNAVLLKAILTSKKAFSEKESFKTLIANQ